MANGRTMAKYGIHGFMDTCGFYSSCLLPVFSDSEYLLFFSSVIVICVLGISTYFWVRSIISLTVLFYASYVHLSYISVNRI